MMLKLEFFPRVLSKIAASKQLLLTNFCSSSLAPSKCAQFVVPIDNEERDIQSP